MKEQYEYEVIGDGPVQFPYGVNFAQSIEFSHMTDWCVETFGRDNFAKGFRTYYFTTEEDRNWFILRW